VIFGKGASAEARDCSNRESEFEIGQSDAEWKLLGFLIPEGGALKTTPGQILLSRSSLVSKYQEFETMFSTDTSLGPGQS
jgi:hypothetical protein